MPWRLMPARARIAPQPLGVVGVMSPWNYPWSLALMPIVDAFAAGNVVMLKPSEHSPATSALLQRLVAQYFTPEELTVVEGDVEVARRFSELPFDHLLFTGSTTAGRQVAQTAAVNLTPVTLELGGKSPAIVAGDANFDQAAADIIFGKGQKDFYCLSSSASNLLPPCNADIHPIASLLVQDLFLFLLPRESAGQ